MITLRSSDLNEVRKVKDALSHHLQERAGIDHSLPRGCELDSIDEGTVKLSLTARARARPRPLPPPGSCPKPISRRRALATMCCICWWTLSLP